MRGTSCFASGESEKALKMSEGSINKFPDDVLGLILSFLPMKEAARTSVLSRRWKFLWTYTTRNLEFDDSMMVHEMLFKCVVRSLEVERRRFVDWINQVLRLYQGPTIDKFKVCFDLDEENSKSDIDSWINFALEKRVKQLELDFTCSQGYFGHGSYTLTAQFLHSYRLDSLTALQLHFVEVTEEVLQYILSSCPFLEVLCVETSKSLVNLKLPDHVLRLRYLEIQNCHSMEYMEISGINLVSFKYCGPKINIYFKNVPQLVEASIGGPFASFLVDNIFQFSSYFSCLETLILDVSVNNFMRSSRFPKMRNLKQLDLWLAGDRNDSLLFSNSLLKASPMLHRFTLKIVDMGHSCGKFKAQKVKRPHQCLKLLEIVGFTGCATDIEFVLHILKIALLLEKIIIDPCSPYASKSKFNSENIEVKVARTRARQLETVLPPAVELVIL